MNDKVLIIGNGFDLDLGLNTRYSDFIASDYFREIIVNNSMAQAVLEEIRINKWIDLESFIKEYVMHNNRRLSPAVTKNEFEEIGNALFLYMSNIDYSNLNRNSNAAKLMQAISDNDDWQIFNFNYTDFEKICSMIGVNTKCIYVHGSVKGNNIIFGSEYSNDIPPQYRFIVKTANRKYNSSDVTNSVMRPEMIIYGHSLGMTDRHYFARTFNVRSKKANSQNSFIRIFTYGESSVQDIFGNIGDMCENGLDEFRKRNNFKIFDNSIKDDEQEICKFLVNVQNGTIKNKAIRRHNGEILWDFGF